MCRLFETIRIENGKAVSLDYHQRRVAKVSSVQLAPHVARMELPDTGVYKLRIDYDTEKGITGTTLEKYEIRRIATLKTVHCDTISYPLKYADRRELDLLHAQRGNNDDVLIIKNTFVTDTTFANILFSAGGKWFTPATPLLKGTCREKLLAEGIVTERYITAADIENYDKAMLINAMLPFDEGRAFPVSGIHDR